VLDKFIIILCLSLGALNLVKAQQRVISFHFDPQPSGRHHFSMDSVSAIAIRADQYATFQLVAGDLLLDIPIDPDAESFTYFLSLAELQSTVQVIADNPAVDAIVYLIFSGDSPSILTDRSKRTSFDCEPPVIYIDPETWRAGLPAPNYTRTLTNETHYIVHHSAGSNSNTNYTQVVRDIYLYHTEVNGWSDIGYNYLVAQNGDVYVGRGIQIVELSDQTYRYDAVLGAHFCGSNSRTMGICLLGNYETTNPADPGISSIISLITFYGLRKGLHPFENASHALGNLSTISGHRNGCSTLCPGESLYNLLPDIRSQVSDFIDCGNGMERVLSFEGDTLVSPGNPAKLVNTSSGYENYTWLIADATSIVRFGDQTNVTFNQLGRFDVSLIGQYSNGSDTLRKADFIRVKAMESTPLIYPNPISGNTLTISYDNPIKSAIMTDISGKIVGEWNQELTKIILPATQGGLFLLYLKSKNQTYIKRLIISK